MIVPAASDRAYSTPAVPADAEHGPRLAVEVERLAQSPKCWKVAPLKVATNSTASRRRR